MLSRLNLDEQDPPQAVSVGIYKEQRTQWAKVTCPERKTSNGRRTQSRPSVMHLSRKASTSVEPKVGDFQGKTMGRAGAGATLVGDALEPERE